MELEINDCSKCGEIGMQARAARLDGRAKSGVLLTGYYCHCMDGDCGNTGPEHDISNVSIELWNEANPVRTDGAKT